ncbi:DUF190 domain-containing protein [Alicyclobacillus shizuokensis]|uniref:DUF190 domain-containing protein n=1 Tax=Alicyclobacillus shizuokensis TaxID=392014 RepID=UPI000836E489|nr:DUF190 domain-containing protein [Alicyclobacillus shizuokensis]MCL6625285.1 DUF190 domain-containing protein [Alicyclobacillus shizuokensis]
MKEDDRFNNLPLYHAVVRECSKRKILWVNVQTAVEEFGTDRVIRKNKIFELSSHAPILVEIFGTVDQIEALVEEIRPMLEMASGPSIILEGQLISPHV